MIVGNGMIGSEFNLHGEKYVDYIVFVSGVSNSEETNADEYNREKFLILRVINENKGLKLIYFSSILVESSKNTYYKMKLEIEQLIRTHASDYLIFRVPQIIGNSGNPNNLINFLKHSIGNDIEITVYGVVERALVGVDDLVRIVDYCKDKVNRETLNFSGIEKLKVSEICQLIGDIMKKQPILNIVNDVENNDWHIPNSDIINDAISGIESNGYTNKVLQKYIKA